MKDCFAFLFLNNTNLLPVMGSKFVAKRGVEINLVAKMHWPYWLCQPSNCPLLKEKGKNGGFRYMIKLRKPGRIFPELLEPIAAAFQVVSAERRAKKFDYHDF